MRLLQTQGTVVNTREAPQPDPAPEETPLPPASFPQQSDEDVQMLDSSDWPAHRSSAVDQALHNLNYMIHTLDLEQEHMVPPTPEETVLSVILHPDCKRVLLSPSIDAQLLPEHPEPAPPWP